MPLAFGPEWQDDLDCSPFSLRFELNSGGCHLTMFTKSYDRARRLARAALSTASLVGIIAAQPEPDKVMGAEWLGWSEGTGFDHLEDMGVSTRAVLAEWEGHFWLSDKQDDEAEPWLHRAVELNWDQVDVLLWNQVASDMGVTPQAAVQSKIVDLGRGIAVHAYDDRGMDITSLTKAPTADLYQQFNEWLLDFDRDRMAGIFES